jgi:hypothetical protein
LGDVQAYQVFQEFGTGLNTGSRVVTIGPGSCSRQSQFYVEDSPRTTWTYEPVFNVASSNTFNIADGDVAGLIAAINTANANCAAATTINLAPGGTYTLTAAAENPSEYNAPLAVGLPVIRVSMTINGNGATIRRSTTLGTPDFTVIAVSGRTAGGPPSCYAYPILTLNQTILTGGSGGGLHMNSGNAVVHGSTISQNTGAGGIVNACGSLTMWNSTVSSNSSDSAYGGGGIFFWGFSCAPDKPTADISFSTIYENSNPGWGRGNAIGTAFAPPGSVRLKNSVLASPSHPSEAVCNSGNNILVSLGHNILGDATDVFGSRCYEALTAPGDMINTNPLLGPLANNGGLTPTHLPLCNSPAIDAAPLAASSDVAGNPVTTDQRGIARPQGAASDIGAVEAGTTVTVTITSQPVSLTKCEGQSATFAVAATGTGLTYQWRKNGSNIPGATNSSFTIASVVALDAGSYDVVVTGACGSANSNPATLSVNLPPAADAGGPYNVNEGGAVTVMASGSDPEGSPLSFAWDLDNDGSFETPGQNASFSAAALDGPGSRTIKARVVDNCGLSAIAQAVANIQNLSPTVGAISALNDPIPVNTTLAASASFTDPGTPDTHTAVWNWDDPSNPTSAGAVTETNGSGSVTGSHLFTVAGVYEIRLTVTDDDGGAGQSIFQYAVVYDPTGGFVTGGGWIDSPAGAYGPDPTLSGRGNFGFVSKYERGANVPTGNTEFQFKAGNFNFHSTVYEWLVIAGAKAQYKGSGKVNGAGDYGFMLTAIDGQINGGGGVDKFRIKIWDKSSGVVIYDNKRGASDDIDTADPQALGGGSIVIHKDK